MILKMGNVWMASPTRMTTENIVDKIKNMALEYEYGQPVTPLPSLYRQPSMKSLILSLFALSLLFLVSAVIARPSIWDDANFNQAKELGRVKWNRNLDEIKAIAKKENKPVFLLFQEVPG